MLDTEINEKLPKLSPQDREEAMRLIEKFYRNSARSRRYEADLLASVASGLTDPCGTDIGEVGAGLRAATIGPGNPLVPALHHR